MRGVANWILDQADRADIGITNMALNKLVYFLYEQLLLQNGERLTKAKIEAWEHGPVFREIYQSFKNFGDRHITSRAEVFSPKTETLEVVAPAITAKDEELFTELIGPYLRLSAAKLREISHSEGGPWHQVWWHEGDTNPGMEITPHLIINANSTGRI